MRILVVLKKYYVLIFIAGLFLFWTSEIIYRNVKIFCLERYAFRTKAIIIDDKNYYGNSPVSKEFSYTFQFTVKGNCYYGNSNNSLLKIGDTILIEYVYYYPNFNRPYESKN